MSCDFDLHFLKTNSVEYLFVCFLVICTSPLEKHLFRLLVRFYSGCLLVAAEMWDIFISLYALNINHFQDTLFANILWYQWFIITFNIIDSHVRHM